MNRPQKRSFRNERGVALILSLAVLGVLLLIVIAFVVSMRTEQVAARNNSYVQTARQLADAGVNDAIYLLRLNTASAIDSTHYFVTQAGRVTRLPTPASPDDALLFSVATAPNPYNINSDRSIIAPNTTYNTAANREIKVDWLNVHEDGKQSSATPLIGRYAFWVDDEASKININAANRRQNLPGATTKEIDLKALNTEGLGISITDEDDSYKYATDPASGPGFFTTELWKNIWSGSGVATSKFLKSEFYLTAYSKDTPLTPWGAARVNLNDPTVTGPAGVATIVGALASANLAPWFPASDFADQNFQDKYGVDGLKSIAARIIDFKTPLPGGASDPNPSVTTDSVDDPTYAGLKETPYINEIALSASVNNDPLVHTATIDAKVEFINQYSVARGNGYELVIQYTIEDGANLGAGAGLPGFVGGPPVQFSDTKTITLSADVPPGGYAVSPNVNLYQSSDASIAGITVQPALKLKIQKIVLKNAALSRGLVDFARNLVVPSASSLSAPLNGTTATLSIEANDPRANDYMTAEGNGGPQLWFDQPIPTLGSQNTVGFNAFLLDATSAAATDLTSDGTEGATPTPFNQSNIKIKNAAFESIGELGYIHTGRPWRSLRLQPRGAGNHIPDWATLDLLCTDQNPMRGRININAQVIHYPGGTPTAMTAKRLVPLVATTGSISGSAYVQLLWPNLDARTAMTSIHDETASSKFPAFVRPASAPWSAFSGVYPFLGLICEMDGVADKVKAGNSINDANREARISQISNLLTLRSNTFTVWAVAQAIIDADKDGAFDSTKGDQIVGEAKVQAVIERIQDPGADGIYGSADDKVSFRTLYFRYLTD